MSNDCSNSRREFVKKAAYVAPAILTLQAAPAYAQVPSRKPSAKELLEQARERREERREARRKRLDLLKG
jgi:hypothetical protein